MTLYHGSERIIETPQFGAGNPRNDYGVGFYCTQHLELAKERACQKNMDGFANEYELDLLGLSVLDVSGAEYTILHWLCILMQNRIFIPKTSFGKENLETLLAKYKLDFAVTEPTTRILPLPAISLRMSSPYNTLQPP